MTGPVMVSLFVAPVALATGILKTILDERKRRREWDRYESFERRVIERHATERGELVRLECGHLVNLYYNRIASLHCSACEASPAIQSPVNPQEPHPGAQGGQESRG